MCPLPLKYYLKYTYLSAVPTYLKMSNMEAFIESVRSLPCLWNPSLPEYREQHVKDAAWQEVVDQFNKSWIPNIQSAKTEWKKLRDNHRDALKRAKLGKNKLLPAQITTWKYAKAMQFLEPHMKYRITENIEMDPPSGAEHDVSTTEKSEATGCKRKLADQTTCESSKVRREPDALESFFNCILQSTRQMPPWMQTQVKKKIFAVVIDAEEQLSSTQENRTTVSNDCDDDTNNSTIETKVKCEVFTEDSCDVTY